MTAKYIVVEDAYGIEYPFLFPPIIQHDDFARKLPIDNGVVVGAGFASLTNEVNAEWIVTCYGESVSLRVKSRAERDSIVFDKMFKCRC
jgi:hypothetical protein